MFVESVSCGNHVSLKVGFSRAQKKRPCFYLCDNTLSSWSKRLLSTLFSLGYLIRFEDAGYLGWFCINANLDAHSNGKKGTWSCMCKKKQRMRIAKIPKLALSPHSTNVPGSIPEPTSEAYVCGGWLFSLWLQGFSLGTLVSSYGPQTCALGQLASRKYKWLPCDGSVPCPRWTQPCHQRYLGLALAFLRPPMN